MHILNIKVGNTKKHIKPVYNLYKNSLGNILNSNINDIEVNIIYTKFKPSKQIVLITQLCIPKNQNILQLSKDFKQVDNQKNKHYNSFVREKSSSKLLPTIVLANYFAINIKSISDIKKE